MPTIAANFTLGARSPIDDRQVVDAYSDLQSLLAYKGLIVYVLADDKVYLCYDVREAQDPAYPDDSTKKIIVSDWKELMPEIPEQECATEEDINNLFK